MWRHRWRKPGHAGDTEPVGDGVRELRFDFGPGYRVYYIVLKNTVILLGGDKFSQVADIDQVFPGNSTRSPGWAGRRLPQLQPMTPSWPEVRAMRNKLWDYASAFAMMVVAAGGVVAFALIGFWTRGKFSLDELLSLAMIVWGLVLLRYVPEAASTSSIKRPPGSLIARIGRSIFTHKFYKKIVEPVLSDFQIEYFEALAQQRMWRARWMRLVYSIMLILTLLLQIPVWTTRTVVTLWKIGPGS